MSIGNPDTEMPPGSIYIGSIQCQHQFFQVKSAPVQVACALCGEQRLLNETSVAYFNKDTGLWEKV